LDEKQNSSLNLDEKQNSSSDEKQNSSLCFRNAGIRMKNKNFLSGQETLDFG